MALEWPGLGQDANGRSCKRARRQVVDHVMFLPLQSGPHTVQDVYKRLVQTNVVSLIEAHTKKRQKIHRLEAESRAKRADVERKKYTSLLLK